MRGIGLLGKGRIRSTRRDAARAHELDRSEARGYPQRRHHPDKGIPILVSHVAKVVVGHQPRLGIVAGQGDGRITMSSKASC